MLSEIFFVVTFLFLTLNFSVNIFQNAIFIKLKVKQKLTD